MFPTVGISRWAIAMGAWLLVLGPGAPPSEANDVASIGRGALRGKAASRKMITPECGATIGPGGSWVLGRGVGSCPSGASALRVIGPVRLDLNGFTVACDGGNSVGLRVEGRRAHVSNGMVEGCGVAIELAGAGRHHVAKVDVSGWSTEGLWVRSDGNRVKRCNAVATYLDPDNNDVGFRVDGNSNRLDGNVVTFGHGGFRLSGDGNWLSENEVFDARESSYRVFGNENRLARNVGHSGQYGDFLIGGQRNRLTRNRGVSNHRPAFRIYGEAHFLSGNFGVGSESACAITIGGIGHTLRRNDFVGIRDAVCVAGVSHRLVANSVMMGGVSGSGLGGVGLLVEGRLHTLLRNLSIATSYSVAPVRYVPTVGFVISGDEHRLRGNVATGHGLSGFIIEETAVGHGLVKNEAAGNNGLADPDHFDLRDENPGCAPNEWRNNRAGTRSQSCIR